MAIEWAEPHDWSPGDLISAERLQRTTTDLRFLKGSIEGLIAELIKWLKELEEIVKRAISAANPPHLDVALSTRASEATLSDVKSQLARLDVALSVLARLQRFGRDVEVRWAHGGEVVAPAANAELVKVNVSSGKVGFIYGFFIAATEANDFKLNWVSGGAARSVRLIFAGKGSLHYVDFIAINEGLPADGGTAITVTNVNAGGAGSIYQARLLYAEV